MLDEQILNRLLNTFISVFSLGAASIIPEAMSLLRILATFEIVLMGIWWLYSHDNSMGVFISKLLGFGVLTYLIEHWGMLTKILLNSFIQIGLKAGGGGISETDFTDPANIAMFGLGVTGHVFSHIKNYSAIETITNSVELFFSGWIAIAIVIAYFALAVMIAIAILEFYAVASISVILLPFAIFQKLAFLAEKALSAVFSGGIRILVLSYITAVILPVMDQLRGGLNPRLADLFLMLLAAGFIVFLALRANKLAQALLYGSPQLTTADVSQFLTTFARNATRITSVAHAIRVRTGAARPPTPPQPRRAP